MLIISIWPAAGIAAYRFPFSTSKQRVNSFRAKQTILSFPTQAQKTCYAYKSNGQKRAHWSQAKPGRTHPASHFHFHLHCHCHIHFQHGDTCNLKFRNPQERATRMVCTYIWGTARIICRVAWDRWRPALMEVSEGRQRHAQFGRKQTVN